jgi:hypothetical protein
MGIIAVIPTEGPSLSLNREIDHRFEEPFHVIVTPGTSPTEVLRHRDVPKPFDPHPEFPPAFVDTVFIEQVNPRLYRLDVPYTTVRRPGEKREALDNPLNRKAEIEVETTTLREIIETDLEGNPLVNTAGDLLVGVEEDETLWDIAIVKNVRPTLPAWFEDYGNALNRDSVRIKGVTARKMQLKISGVKIPDSQAENGIEFIRLSIRMLYRKKGWERRFLNFGLREKVFHSLPFEAGQVGFQSYSTLEPIRDHKGHVIEQPVALDAEGRACRETITQEDGTIQRILRAPTKAEIESNVLTYKTRPVLPFRRLPLS